MHLAELSPGEFSERAKLLLVKAESLCTQTPDCDLDQWLEAAKKRGMTWVEALEWTLRAHGQNRGLDVLSPSAENGE